MSTAVLIGNGISAVSSVSPGTLGNVLTSNGSAWVSQAGGSGTVTSVSVVSTNGFAGTVTTANVTPAITISTTITGVLKGNGTAISAATAGTDYIIPGGALGTPSSGTLTNCTFPTLNQNTTGSAASLSTTNFSIVQSGTDLLIKYNGTNIAKISSAGAFTAINNVTAFGTI